MKSIAHGKSNAFAKTGGNLSQARANNSLFSTRSSFQKHVQYHRNPTVCLRLVFSDGNDDSDCDDVGGGVGDSGDDDDDETLVGISV